CKEKGTNSQLPLSGRVKFEWEIIKGGGEFKQLGCLPENVRNEVGDYVIYQPPYVPLPEGTERYRDSITELKLKIIDDNPTQPVDATVERQIMVKTRRYLKDPDIYEVTVESAKYKLPEAPAKKTTEGDCQAKNEEWKMTDDLKEPKHQLPNVEDKDTMVVGQWMRLMAVDMRDNDEIKILCDSKACDDSELTKVYEDNVEWNWKVITSKGGEFVTGKDRDDRSRDVVGRYVIYEAPLMLDKPFMDVEIGITVTDNLNEKATKQAKDTQKSFKFKIRVYRAGIEMEQTPVTWLPKKDTIVKLESRLKYERTKDDWQPALAHMCRIHFFQLEDVSREPGYAMNLPEPKQAKVCRDLRLKDGDGHEAYERDKMPKHPKLASNRKYQKCENDDEYLIDARTKEPEREYKIDVHSEDYASFAKLMSWANREMPGKWKDDYGPYYVSIPLGNKKHHKDNSRKVITYEDNRVTIPRDVDENHIADNGWLVSRGKSSFWVIPDPKDRTEDNDHEAKGDGYRGDGLTAYEEYRGFEVKKPRVRHIRTSTAHKDLFVWNKDDLSIDGFRSAFEIKTHEVREEGLAKGSDNIYYINFNAGLAHEVDQAGLYLFDGKGKRNKDDGALLGKCISVNDVDNRPKGPWGPPNNVMGVFVNVDKVKAKAEKNELDFDAKLKQVVAHELGHAVNTYHHGKTDGRNGVRSGNMVCVMRYDNHSSTTEAIGTGLCTPANKNLNNDPNFGPPANGRGGCSEQWRVSGSAKAPPPKNRVN
ncbi:MAG: hypothetical protein R3330_00330, partial [Saprospiraceae bacterium]|nr:hypothetical protein [Saprospiraceae bacterium]